MRPHHTKDKGDVGVAHAIADLADQGFVVLTALCEHAPFDLVGYRSSWSDSHGASARPVEKNEVDVLCIYCPDTGACYYVDPRTFGSSVSSRVTPSRNGQACNVLVAGHFRAVPAALGSRQIDQTVSTVPRTPAVS